MHPCGSRTSIKTAQSKVVRDQELVRIDETAGTVEIDGDGKDVYNATGLHELAAAGSGRLTLLGTGTDNDRPVDVRETIDIGPVSFTMRREVKPKDGAFFTRHVYAFARKAPSS